MFVSRLTGDCKSVPFASTVLTINLNQSKKTEMNRMFIEALSLITTLLYLKTSLRLITLADITTHNTIAASSFYIFSFLPLPLDY